MGAVCPGCVRGPSAEEEKEKAYYQTAPHYPPWPQQQPAPPPPQPRPREQIKQQPQQPLRPQQQALQPQYAQQPQPQQQRRTTIPTTEAEDRARSDEARANAAIAAQKRAEAFEKSAGGRAARTAIAAAKANPLPSRNEPGLRWVVG